MKRLASAIAMLAVTACTQRASSGGAAVSPQAAVDELLAADRAFSAASARTDLVTGLSAMFAPDVAMPVPGGWAEGAPAVIEALRSNPANALARIEWTPIRGGVSADGQQGFTFGYMTLYRPDSTTAPMKYLAYWVKRPEGWRIAVFRRRPRPEAQPSLAMLPPSLPERLVPVASSGSARFGESLAEAERSFSRDAQRIGLGPAFAQYGRADAVNMGGPTDTTFVFGAEAIARGVPAGTSVSWGPNRVIVASSGDLGVTIGMIYPNAPAADGSRAAGFPFFTVWQRTSPAAPWRYIAE